MLKVAVYGFIRVVFSFSVFPSWAGFAVITFGISLSAIVGRAVRVIERNMKRAFASAVLKIWDSFSLCWESRCIFLSQHFGSAVIAIAQVIIVFALFHAVCHALFKTALFFEQRRGVESFPYALSGSNGGTSKKSCRFFPSYSYVPLWPLFLSRQWERFMANGDLSQNIIRLLRISALGTNTLIMLDCQSWRLWGLSAAWQYLPW